MEPRHFDQMDEDTNEAPWGTEKRPDVRPEPAAPPQRSLRPGLLAAFERYRLARAALRGHRDPDTPIDRIEPITPTLPVRRIRDLRL
jgi:hypothetical protein